MPVLPITDELWEAVGPLLPEPPSPKRPDRPGRPPLDPRKALTGIVLILSTGMRWNDLPACLGLGCGSVLRKKLRAWQAAGVWDRLHALVLKRLDGAGRIDWSTALADTSHRRAVGAGEKNRAEPGGPAQGGHQGLAGRRRRGRALGRGGPAGQRQRRHRP